MKSSDGKPFVWSVDYKLNRKSSFKQVYSENVLIFIESSVKTTWSSSSKVYDFVGNNNLDGRKLNHSLK